MNPKRFIPTTRIPQVTHILPNQVQEHSPEEFVAFSGVFPDGIKVDHQSLKLARQQGVPIATIICNIYPDSHSVFLEAKLRLDRVYFDTAVNTVIENGIGSIEEMMLYVDKKIEIEALMFALNGYLPESELGAAALLDGPPWDDCLILGDSLVDDIARAIKKHRE